jgi:hypothetical protein
MQHVVVDADDVPLELTHAVGLPGAWTVEHEYAVGR